MLRILQGNHTQGFGSTTRRHHGRTPHVARSAECPCPQSRQTCGLESAMHEDPKGALTQDHAIPHVYQRCHLYGGKPIKNYFYSREIISRGRKVNTTKDFILWAAAGVLSSPPNAPSRNTSKSNPMHSQDYADQRRKRSTRRMHSLSAIHSLAIKLKTQYRLENMRPVLKL